jgi:hypothetical protein
LTKSENETNKIGDKEREYLGGIDETLSLPIKATVAEVDADVALKLYAEDRKREKWETANRRT